MGSRDCFLRAVCFFSLFEMKNTQQSKIICVLSIRFKILYEFLICRKTRIFFFLPSRILRKPIYSILNDLIAAHVAGEWGGLEAVARGQSSGMTYQAAALPTLMEVCGRKTAWRMSGGKSWRLWGE